jgi:hypothetical protein
MATFEKLLKDGLVTPVVLKLRRGQFYERKLYALPECVDWMKTIPHMATGRIASDMTPQEQFVERVRQWLAGEHMEDDRRFHDMRPKDHHVWELKTSDLRIFGWMYRPRQFIAARGGFADDFKGQTRTKSYDQEKNLVVKLRNDLPLDGDKFVTGEFHELI